MSESDVPTAGSGAEIIPAPRELEEKCVQPGNASLAALQAIANAEAALQDLSVNFEQWMAEEVERLCRARAALRHGRPDSETLEKLFEASHDLKGQAATLGYPLAAKICASLCRLLDACQDAGAVPTPLIDHHVDAVRAIVRERVTGADHETAGEIADRLRGVTETEIERLQHNSGPAAA